MTKIIAAFMVIGLADLLYARSLAKEMMMSKYDVKQEYKQQEGDPHHKGERKRMAHELLFGGGAHNVKNADAVVVNPEHIAVAIKYDKEKGKAPRVVAKGVRIHAEKIKELAKQYGVPILRNVPLAQALNNKLEIDEEVPEELYEAVAEVLAFVYKLKEEQENRHKGRGKAPEGSPGQPQPPVRPPPKWRGSAQGRQRDRAMGEATSEQAFCYRASWNHGGHTGKGSRPGPPTSEAWGPSPKRCGRSSGGSRRIRTRRRWPIRALTAADAGALERQPPHGRAGAAV